MALLLFVTGGVMDTQSGNAIVRVHNEETIQLQLAALLQSHAGDALAEVLERLFEDVKPRVLTQARETSRPT